MDVEGVEVCSPEWPLSEGVGRVAESATDCWPEWGVRARFTETEPTAGLRPSMAGLEAASASRTSKCYGGVPGSGPWRGHSHP